MGAPAVSSSGAPKQASVMNMQGYMLVTGDDLQPIWMPDIYFADARRVDFTEVTYTGNQILNISFEDDQCLFKHTMR